MKKFWFLAIFCLMVAKAYGVTGLTIDGSTTPTVINSNSFELVFSFEQSGAEAEGIVYLDVNGDQALDAGDKWLFRRKLTDGGFDDGLDGELEAADGSYRETCDPFKFSGKFLFFAEDDGVSDCVPLTVDAINSGYSVSGTVNPPANQAGIFVCLVEVIDEEKAVFEYGYGDFTDGAGHFTIGVPTSHANRTWKIVALDAALMAPQYASNDLVDDSLFIDGDEVYDLAMNQVGADTSTIYGILKDNTGTPIQADISVVGLAGLQITPPRWPRAWKSDENGAFRVPLKKAGPGVLYLYMVSTTISDQFHDQYMNPHISQTYGVGGPTGSAPQINLDLTAYTANTSITGHVYFNGEPYDRCKLYCNTIDKGNNFTKTYSDGRYEMRVSDVPDSFTIGVLKESIPAGGHGDPSYRTGIAPGATGVDFNVVAVEEAPQPRDLSFKVWPNPFGSSLMFTLSGSRDAGDLILYDIAGNCVARISPTIAADHEASFTLSKTVPTGIYFYSVTAGGQVFKGKVIKLQ